MTALDHVLETADLNSKVSIINDYSHNDLLEFSVDYDEGTLKFQIPDEYPDIPPKILPTFEGEFSV